MERSSSRPALFFFSNSAASSFQTLCADTKSLDKVALCWSCDFTHSTEVLNRRNHFVYVFAHMTTLPCVLESVCVSVCVYVCVCTFHMCVRVLSEVNHQTFETKALPCFYFKWLVSVLHRKFMMASLRLRIH